MSGSGGRGNGIDPDDLLDHRSVLAEERAHVRGDDIVLPDLGAERRHRLESDEPWRALCLSGGGLRSAVFTLGAAQGLAARGVLHRFDYLSTVSGGGYTGAALSAYAARLRVDAGPPPDEAARDVGATAAPMAEVAERIAPDPAAPAAFVAHLREYASYLTPRLGALSPDLSAMLALTLRNLAIVWLVLLPVLTALLLGPQFVAMVLLELAVPEDRAAQRFAFGATAALLLAWCFVYPELATAGRWRWLGSRTGLALCLLAPLGLASMCLVIAGLSVPTEPVDGVTAPAPGIDAMVDWLGPALTWLPAGVIAIATVRVLLRRLLRGPCSPRMLLRQWLGATIGGGVVGVLALVLLAETGHRWLGALAIEPVPGWHWGAFILDATMLAGPALLSLWLVFDVIHVGIASGRRDDLDREHMASVTSLVLMVAGGWLVWCALSFGQPLWLFAPQLWLLGSEWRPWFVPGLAAACVAVLAVVGLRWLSAPLHDLSPTAEDGRRVARDARIAGTAAVLLLLLVLRTLASSGTVWQDMGDTLALRAGANHRSPTGQTERESQEQSSSQSSGVKATSSCVYVHDPAEALPCVVSREGAAARWWDLILVFVAWSLVAGTLIQVNRFSMHEIYRTRIARTFLGASRAAPGVSNAMPRRPDPLTGFDADDDLPMSALQGLRPMLVVNTALNRASADALQGQERRARPFSISPLHAGSAADTIGYRRVQRYASRTRFESAESAAEGGGMRLGTAVALSGAATSPSMGYGTNGLASFVLTAFNVRLGLWLGHPRSRDAWTRVEPPFSVVPLLRDLIADTDDTGNWINLSDGGHFDNLGLYEMLQRRCRLILCIDATNDGRRDLHHLARVVRMAAVDQGVTIEALPVPDTGPMPPVLAYRIVWPETTPGADGLLLVIKPTLCGDEPVDIAQYAQAHPEFPHESTSDQFFGEGQFECYRRLGLLSMQRLERFVDGPLQAHPWAVTLAAPMFARG